MSRRTAGRKHVKFNLADIHLESIQANAKHVANSEARAEKRLRQRTDEKDFLGPLTVDGYNPIASVEEGPGDSIPAPTTRMKWRYIELLVDSGAVDNVASPKLLLEYFVRQPDGSKCGLHYLAAYIGRIPDMGEQHLLS